MVDNNNIILFNNSGGYERFQALACKICRRNTVFRDGLNIFYWKMKFLLFHYQ